MSTVSNQEEMLQAVTPTGFLRIDHVGIVVQEMDAALKTYCEGLGFRLLQRLTIPEQLVEAAFWMRAIPPSN